MTDSFRHLTQDDLLRLGLEALHASADSRALVFLREAADRSDATGKALFLLGSLYADAGLYELAAETMARSLELDPSDPVARFQLGLLHLTGSDPEAAQRVWAPLAERSPSDAFRVFHEGLERLIREDFSGAVERLKLGMSLNESLPVLNGDIAALIQRIENLAVSAASLPAASAGETTAADSPVHALYLSAYARSRTH
jgi:tetratricopeptide (TPR) repeat protein